jgi:hypothetical protein
MSRISASTYREAADLNLGWCTKCEDFTRDAVEPDAEHYNCPNCKNLSVFGAGLALVVGDIELLPEEVEEDGDDRD